jgi:hypothetical protein
MGSGKACRYARCIHWRKPAGNHAGTRAD